MMSNRYVKESFSYWATHPNDTTEADIRHLEEAVLEYPFCQILHILAAKSRVNHQPSQAEPHLQKAAAYALSRNKLRQVIENEFEWSANVRERRFENLLIWPNDYQKTPSTAYPKPHWELPSLADIRWADEQQTLTSPDSLPIVPPIDDTTLRENTLQNELIQIENTPTIEDIVDQRQLERQHQMAIIDSFIENENKIGPIRANPNDPLIAEPEDLAKKRTLPFDSMPVSEGLAKIMVRQGKIERAIEIYEQLMLKKPEKKAYFAEKIKELTNE
ncbi:MAG: hypothetical protein ACK4GN_16435 [Runella sp.]